MISVLYVDDDAMLDVAKPLLEKHNDFFVDTEKTVKGAIEKIRSGKYETVVSDYELPELNGIEFLKTLRNSGSTVPFIIFTGRGREEVAIEALNNGADFYLQKGGPPLVLFSELSSKIRELVERRRIETENKKIISLEGFVGGIIIGTVAGLFT